MPWVISGLTRMHPFFSRPSTIRPVAIFLEALIRSELPSSFLLKLLDLVFSLNLHCITAATSKFRFVMPSRPWGPCRSWDNLLLILPWSYQLYMNIVKDLSCHGLPPITWWWSTFYRCFNLETYRLHITVMVGAFSPHTVMVFLPSIKLAIHYCIDIFQIYCPTINDLQTW